MTRLPDLTADCANCAALCCIALAMDEGEEFAIDKPAGLPCPHLDGFACAIHDDLKARGFGGCVKYDCLGAGQRVTQELFAGQSWQDEPELARPMMDAFARMREVQKAIELLVIAERLDLPASYEARRQAMLDALTPEGGFAPESFAAPAVDDALAGVTPFLGELRDFV